MQLISGKQAKPRRILLYGQHGIGKSSWAASARGAVFIDTEGGLGDIDCQHFPQCYSLGDVRESMVAAENVPGIRWLIIDSLDWLETLIWADVCAKNNVDSIEKVGGGYGKGYTMALAVWDKILTHLDALRSRGIGVIFLAHAKVSRFEDPAGPSYDRYEPSLHQKAAAAVMEWCDEVLFARTRVAVVKEDMGFNKERGMARGGKDRLILTNESAAAIAKNRLRLPDELPLEWSAYAQYLPDPSQIVASAKPQQQPAQQPVTEPGAVSEMNEFFGGDIEGIVTDGSSKKQTQPA